jgi:hypothetical protein
MTKREELQKQYAEYERNPTGKNMPLNEICEFGDRKQAYKISIIYDPTHDRLEIIRNTGGKNGYAIGPLPLSGDEAEKLYHFLGGLYG